MIVPNDVFLHLCSQFMQAGEAYTIVLHECKSGVPSEQALKRVLILLDGIEGTLRGVVEENPDVKGKMPCTKKS